MTLVLTEGFNVVVYKNVCVYVMRCAFWYYFYSLKNVKNTHGGVLLLVKLQDASIASNAPPLVFFHVF